MGIETAVAIGISTAISAGTQVMQAQEKKKQAKIQERNARAEQRLNELQNQRAARQAMRQSRIQQAALINAAATSGTTGSSGALGGIASIANQGQANTTFMNTTGVIQDDMLNNQRQIMASQKKEGMWGAIGQVASTVGKAASNYGELSGAGENFWSGTGTTSNSTDFNWGTTVPGTYTPGAH